MIESIELNIYLDNDTVSFSVSPVQTEVIFKALGLQFDPNTQTVSAFSNNSLQKHILPKVNFSPQ
ncbi:hypothetical protein [Bacillus pseudomycoides]|uniref:hypothetical protein n=1 Tax=Bacillus pseudomycoides TaxID=64104 RepID=UPI000985F36F|nr:hypothetical protein [Bacillus pseudomycoides]MDF2086909.1 hypothetical protein [Bacillus pseudomycoides]OOG90335.1 hypothetical protein BTH41_03273 [Bacillus mycoides]PEL20406.1 hypothetical protein CN608_24790 [Bacillus pseudomycoides]